MPMFSHGEIHTVELSHIFAMFRSNLVGDWMTAVSRYNSEFNAHTSFEDALNAAEFGQWDAPTIESLSLPVLTSESDDMRYFNDVTGDQLDVAAYCAGEPEYWQTAESIYKPQG